MKLSKNDLKLLGTLTTRNEAGVHFMQGYLNTWLDRMEKQGAIIINRPIHQSGNSYSQEYYTVEVTQEAITAGEARNWGE